MQMSEKNGVLYSFHNDYTIFHLIWLTCSPVSRWEYEFISFDKECPPGTSVMAQILGHHVFHAGAFLNWQVLQIILDLHENMLPAFSICRVRFLFQ